VSDVIGIDVPDAEMSKRTHDSVHDRRSSADARGFSHPLRTERMVRRRCDGLGGFPVRGFHDSGPEIVHKAAPLDVSGLAVLDFLE